MKQIKLYLLFFILLFSNYLHAQVGVGTATPAAKLTVNGTGNNASIPGPISTGIFRIGVSNTEGIDFGKMSLPPYSGWIQSGFNGTTVDPLVLQPNGGAVGIGTASPNASAALDVTSTTQGFLPPRMTSAQIDSVNTPVEGLMIYNTTSKKQNYFNGTKWINFDGSFAFSIGDNFRGGKIAYILQGSDPGYDANVPHGLIAAASDQSIAAEWGCFGTAIPGADGIQLGTGNQNTIDIMAGCATGGIAARICGDLVLNGYSDWYLPSRDELQKLYLNRVAVGGFAIDFYWTSSESTNFLAWFMDFSSGSYSLINRSSAYRVRAIRAF